MAGNFSYVKSEATAMLECATARRMGRIKRWAEDMQARFPEGTFARIAAVLVDGEDRTDFVRKAVEKEIESREVSHHARKREKQQKDR